MYRRNDRRRAVGGGDASPRALQIDWDAERGAERRGVGADSERNLEFVEACAGHGEADLTAAVLRHEVDRFRRDLRRRHGEIAFVLAILIVHDDDHATGFDGGDRIFDR